MKISKMFAAAMLTAAVSSAAHAQATINCGGAGEPALGATCNVQNQVSATVAAVARLNITTSNTALTAPTAAQFGTGGNGAQIVNAGPTLNVSANVPHTITATAPAVWTGTGAANKPSSDLEIQVNGGSFSPIGGFGAFATPTDLKAYALQFGTRYNWTIDTPGTYNLMLTFTLTSP